MVPVPLVATEWAYDTYWKLASSPQNDMLDKIFLSHCFPFEIFLTDISVEKIDYALGITLNKNQFQKKEGFLV